MTFVTFSKEREGFLGKKRRSLQKGEAEAAGPRLRAPRSPLAPHVQGVHSSAGYYSETTS